MIKIPLSPQVKGGAIAPLMDKNTGTEGLQAIAQLGKDMQGVGDKMIDHQAKLNQLESEKNMRQRKQDLRLLTMEFQNELIGDNDPSSWNKRYNDKVASYLASQTAGGQMTSDDIAQLNQWTDNYRQEQSLGIERDAITRRMKDSLMNLDSTISEYQARGMFEEAAEEIGASSVLSPAQKKKLLTENGNRQLQFDKQDAFNQIEFAEGTGKEDVRNAAFETLRQIMPKPEWDKLKADSDHRVALTNFEALVDANPSQMAELLDDPQAAISEYPGITLQDIPRLQGLADTKVKRDFAEEFDKFSNEIDTIKSPDQIPLKYPNMEKRHHDIMADQWRLRQAKNQKLDAVNPVKIQEASQRIKMSLNELNEAGREDWIRYYSDAKTEIEALGDPGLKTYYEEKLKAKVENRKERLSTGMKKLEAVLEAEAPIAVSKPTPITISRAIKMPWIQDTAQLTLLGMTEDAAKDVVEAKTEKDRVAAFKAAFGVGPGAKTDPDDLSMISQNAPENLKKFAYAILQGKAETGVIDEAEEIRYRQRLKKRDEFNAYVESKLVPILQDDPDADVSMELENLLGSDEAASYLPDILGE